MTDYERNITSIRRYAGRSCNQSTSICSVNTLPMPQPWYSSSTRLGKSRLREVAKAANRKMHESWILFKLCAYRNVDDYIILHIYNLDITYIKLKYAAHVNTYSMHNTITNHTCILYTYELHLCIAQGSNQKHKPLCTSCCGFEQSSKLRSQHQWCVCLSGSFGSFLVRVEACSPSWSDQMSFRVPPNLFVFGNTMQHPILQCGTMPPRTLQQITHTHTPWRITSTTASTTKIYKDLMVSGNGVALYRNRSKPSNPTPGHGAYLWRLTSQK